MSTQANVQKVQEIYAAFGKGDIKTITSSLAEDVDWQTIGPPVFPHAGPHHGPKEVEQFFGKIMSTFDVKKFEPREFIAEGDKVVVLGSIGGNIKPTGKSYEAEWAMVWSFRNGKVVKWREYIDTAKLAAALVA